MFCPKCGNQLPDGAKFCGKCGAQVGAASTPAPTPTPAPAPTPTGVPVRTPSGKSNKTKWIILAAALVVVIAVVVILIVTLGGGSGGGAKDFETVIDKYFDAFEDNNTKAIVKLYPTQLYEFYEDMYDGDEEGFLEGMDNYYDMYGREVEDWEIFSSERLDENDLAMSATVLKMLDLKIKDSVAVEVYAEFEDGEEEDMLFTLIRVGSKWYLLNVGWSF